MTKSKYTDRFWYFRNVADEDDDDYTGDSLMVPVSSITGMAMVATGKLTIWFEGARNSNTYLNPGATDTIDGQNGYVTLAITTGKGKEVMRGLVELINAGPHHNGVTVIADDSTTDYDGTTRAAVYALPHITSCYAINNSYNGAA